MINANCATTYVPRDFKKYGHVLFYVDFLKQRVKIGLIGYFGFIESAQVATTTTSSSVGRASRKASQTPQTSNGGVSSCGARIAQIVKYSMNGSLCHYDKLLITPSPNKRLTNNIIKGLAGALCPDENAGLFDVRLSIERIGHTEQRIALAIFPSTFFKLNRSNLRQFNTFHGYIA